MSLLALVVDDSLLIRHTIGRFLQRRGFHVATANDGVEALEALSTLRPDLICTDLQMPRICGYKLIDEIRERPEIAHIPILVLAGKPLGDEQPEPRAYAVIYKDASIEAQLSQAVESLFPSLVGLRELAQGQ